MGMTTFSIELSSPEALMQAFSERFNRGDLAGLVALYEPNAVFEPQPGTCVRGREAIRGALAELLAMQPALVAQVVQVLASEDVALVVNAWEMNGTAPDGAPVHQGGRSADVVRRQPDGRWLV